MKRTKRMLMVALLTVAAVNGATPNRGALRPAWEWSLEERIDARLAAARAGQVQVVDGSEHPEWLLPSELFARLLDSATSDLTRDPENDPRMAYRSRLSRLGIDEHGFWSVIRKVGDDYGELRKKSFEIENVMLTATPAAKQGLQQRLAALQWRECAERAKAYRLAGQLLGPQHLDQILYQVVAPGLSMVMSNQYTAQDLRATERGCQ
jgi:hypothetical protein